MLTAKIYSKMVLENLAAIDGGIQIDQSCIKAFTSPCISMDFVETAGEVEIWIGEGDNPRLYPNNRNDAQFAYRSVRSAEGVNICLRQRGGACEVIVDRTLTGGCPIYVAQIPGGGIILSWKFDEVVMNLSKRVANIDVCERYIEYGPQCARDQIFDGMFMLWPGERLQFRDGIVTFYEASSEETVVPTPIREDARVSDFFIESLQRAISGPLSRAKNPLLELSGGFDSSCVAIAAAGLRGNLNTYAVIHEGAMGKQQALRRKEIVSKFGFNDYTATSAAPAPFESLSVGECRITPYDDIFRLPCIEAVSAHPGGPFDLVLTGLGGDEFSMAHTYYCEPWQLRVGVSPSAADAVAGRSDMFMRRGIWLSQPFVNRNVVDFGRALPKKIREGRLLNIITMVRAGLSEGYIFQKYYEHYGNGVIREASLLDFDEFFDGSVLFDLNLGKMNSILTDAVESSKLGMTNQLAAELWKRAKLDAVLKYYL